MIRGRVVGEVWATKKSPRIAGMKLVLVAELQALGDGGYEPTGRVVVATDNLDAGAGQDVVLAFGSGARNAIEPLSRDVLTDASVVQVIDGSSS